MSAARTIQMSHLLLSFVLAGSATAAGQSTFKHPPAASAETTPQAQEERATAPESAKPAAPKQAGPAPARAGQKAPTAKRIPPRRRSVQQVIGSVVPATPAAPSYGPVLTPPPGYRAPSTVTPTSVAGVPPVTPPPPAQINTCTGSFCTDAAGGTYNNGVGSAAVNSQGRLCNRVGNTMQCF